MLISVIIPTCNRSYLLRQCLELLSPHFQAIEASLYEVVVTDDSKESNARSLIEEKYNWVTWVKGPEKGPAANRNHGVKLSKGDWLIFIDDDCLPQKHWLQSYLENIKSDDREFVLEGRTKADRPKVRFNEEAPLNLAGNRLWSCNFAIKRDLFEKLNGFDESFPYAAMEDVDFYTRVVVTSSIKFLPQAIVIHPWRTVAPFTSFNKHLRSHIHYARKYELSGKASFRWSRIKIFAGSIIPDFKELLRFYMKGWLYFFEKAILNFCLIFI